MHRAVSGLVEVYLIEGNPLKASVFSNIQSQLYRNYDEDEARALEAAQRALALKRTAGETSSLFVDQAAIGTILLALGRPGEAVVSFRAARDGEPDPLSNHAAIQWRSIVQADLAMSDVKAARADAHAFSQRALRAPASFRAHSLLASSEVDAAENQFDAALDDVKSARALVQQDPARETMEIECAATLATLVLDTTRSLPFDEALALAERIDREFPGLVIEITPFARAAIRSRERLSGDFADIIREDSETLRQARASHSASGQIEALRSLAATYATFNAMDQATAMLKDAYALAKDAWAPAGRPVGVVNASDLYGLANDLGEAYAQGGHLSDARATFEDTAASLHRYTDAAMRRDLGDRLAGAVVGLARVTALEGDAPAAIKTLTAALDGVPADARFDRADVLTRLARLERDQAPADAVQHYEAAIASYRDARDRVSEISVRLQLADFLARTPDAGADRLDRARRHLAIVARDATLLNYADATWRMDFVDGLVAEADGHPSEALDHYTAAVGRLDQIRAGLNVQEQRAAFVDTDTVQDLYRRAVRLSLAANDRDRAWAFLERGKARTFLEQLQGHRFAADAASPETADLRKLEQRIIDLRASLSPEAQVVQRGAGMEPTVVLAQLRHLEEQFALSRQQSLVASNRATQPLSVAPIQLGEVQRRLPEHAALVEYSLLDDTIAAFVVSGSTVESLSWPADTSLLRTNVQALRVALSHLSGPGNPVALAQTVSATLLPNVLAHVPADVDHLIIVPAGYLAYLPFEVLPVAAGTQLIDRYAISYLPSASTLQFLRPWQTPSGHERLFLGALGNATVEDWPSLPGTIVETDRILKLYPTATRVIEGAFTSAAARDALEHDDWVHFATHGLVDEQAPMFSAVLMGSNTAGSTRLSMYEIADVPIKANLVVLSACETGLGRLFRGDEVVGLTRTLLQAGAGAVVSSLWKVSDDSTAQLMETFYSGLRSGLPPSQALREAAISTRKQYGMAFFWAPFVLTGVE